MVIRGIMKNFNYLVQQNRGNEDAIVEGLQALGLHPFGNHSMCNESWCGHKDNPNLKFKNLPFGKPLSDCKLQVALQDMFNSYLSKGKQLSMLGSTQANESLNKTIASKAPKAHHFSSSANLNYCVAAGVCQKNIGEKYVLSVRML